MEINVVDEMINVLLDKQRCEFHYGPTDRDDVKAVVDKLTEMGYHVNATYVGLGTPKSSVIITIRKVI